MIKEATAKLVGQQEVSFEESKQVMKEMMEGTSTPVQTAAYLAALATNGETIAQITGSAEQMRAHALHLDHHFPDVFEIVGTGGDGSNSFNISTTASIVIAAAGIKVAKHGNRAASSACGAADCLEALGVNIELSPEKCVALLDQIGICFLFAPYYHSSMKYVAPVRKELGIRTIFNVLGPLTNPAGADIQLMGVYDEDLVEPLAQVLSNLGVKRGMVVYGMDKLDEISLSAPTKVCEIQDGQFKNYMISPEDFGLTRCQKEDLTGGNPQENALITRSILSGMPGPKRDAVLLNAGASLYLNGVVETIQAGVDYAAQLIDGGEAAKKLQDFIALSNQQ